MGEIISLVDVMLCRFYCTHISKYVFPPIMLQSSGSLPAWILGHGTEYTQENRNTLQKAGRVKFLNEIFSQQPSKFGRVLLRCFLYSLD